MNQWTKQSYTPKIPRGPLELFGLNTDVHASNDEEVIQLAVPSTYLNAF